MSLIAGSTDGIDPSTSLPPNARPSPLGKGGESGGANSTGPNLVGVEGRKPGTEAGYAYSPAMQAFGAKTPAWDYDQLYNYLKNPQALPHGGGE